MVRAILGVQLKDRIKDRDSVLVFGSNGSIDLIIMASILPCYGHVLRRMVLRWALLFEVYGQINKEGQKRAWKEVVNEGTVFGLRVEGALCQFKVDYWRQSDYHSVNPATLSCFKYYWIENIGFYLSFRTFSLLK